MYIPLPACAALPYYRNKPTNKQEADTLWSLPSPKYSFKCGRYGLLAKLVQWHDESIEVQPLWVCSSITQKMKYCHPACLLPCFPLNLFHTCFEEDEGLNTAVLKWGQETSRLSKLHWSISEQVQGKTFRLLLWLWTSLDWTQGVCMANICGPWQHSFAYASQETSPAFQLPARKPISQRFRGAWQHPWTKSLVFCQKSSAIKYQSSPAESN